MPEKKKSRVGCFPARGLYFALACVYLELCFDLLIFKRPVLGMFYGFLSAVSLGLFLAVLTNLGGILVRRISGWIFQSVLCVLAGTQYVYYHIFRTFLSYEIVIRGGGGEALGEFKSITLTAIWKNLPGVLLLLLPLLFYGCYLRLERKSTMELFKLRAPSWTAVLLAASVVVHLMLICLLPITGSGNYSAFELYHKEWVKDLSFQKLGFLTSTRLDVCGLLQSSDSSAVSSEAATLADLSSVQSEENHSETQENGGETDQAESEQTEQTEQTTRLEEETTTAQVVLSNHVLDIDFSALAQSETNSDVKWLHEYMSNSEPTSKNKYTGMFEGYNLILICAESFSPWAVDAQVTPTLYKLVNTGFVFTNFYVNAFNNTSDGEYMLCTGLLPNGQGTGTFQSTVKNGTAEDGRNDMALCFGNLLGKQGYITKAYHDHTYTYYKRHLTHPNMGYDYKGQGGGLELRKTWPESDLEMMQATLPDYIDNEPFHAYYMSVSGHMNYDFVGNYMAYQNKSYVEDLNLSESLKAYLAAQKELDLALEYLISQLEESGAADHTIIAMAADHYPYALADELAEAVGEEADWYGVYHSNLVLWSASMEEPVTVTKVCSSIDIAPTLCNLMGIEYDSRLYIGNDILSDTPGLVIFSDKGFVTDYCVYNPTKGKWKALTDIEVTQDYVDSVINIVKQRWTASGKIVTTDYYSYLDELD